MPSTARASVTLSEADADEGRDERDQRQLGDRPAGVAERDRDSSPVPRWPR